MYIFFGWVNNDKVGGGVILPPLHAPVPHATHREIDLSLTSLILECAANCKDMKIEAKKSFHRINISPSFYNCYI